MTAPKHIVAVAGLVSDPQGCVLMIRSPRRGWEIPGGQVEEGEDLIHALEREVREETGLKVVVKRLAGVSSNIHSHIVIFDFLCDPVGGEITTSPESTEVEWVDRAKALDRVEHPPMRDRIRSLLEESGHARYRSYSLSQPDLNQGYVIHFERELL